MKPFFVALCCAWLLPSASFAEAVHADMLKGKSIDQWISQLGSDVFKERETASIILGLGGDGVIPALRKALEHRDSEVRLRARLALCELTPVSIEGVFMRVASESFVRGGRPTIQSNETGASTLRVEKGRVFFKQDYGNGVEQVYSFDAETPLEFRKYCSIELNWESIDNKAGYNPDSRDARLECHSTELGTRLVFFATDTAGTSCKMTYAPKADVEKELSGAKAKPVMERLNVRSP